MKTRRCRLLLLLLLLTLLSGLAQAQTPTIGSVVNGASFAPGAIAPGEILIIFGSNLGDATLKLCPVAPVPAWPTVCSGVTVLVNGKAAPIAFVSASQIE